jgi:hypothetical protein
MHEYRYGRGIKILVWICSLFLMTIFIGLPIVFFLDGETPSKALYFIIPISLLFVGLSIAAIWDVMITKVILTGRYIHSISILGDRKLRTEEIASYKQGRNYITIYPKNKHQPKIKITTFFSFSHMILSWLDGVGTDLDEKEVNDELEDFYKNTAYGLTDTERELQLQKAKKLTKIVNSSSIGITLGVLATLFTGKLSLMILIFILIILPLIVLLIVAGNKGIIKFKDKGEDPHTTIYPSAFWGFSAPIFLLCLLALFKINLFNGDHLWELFAVVVFFLFVACIMATREYKLRNVKEFMFFFGILIICSMYSYGAIMYCNTLLDINPPKVVKAPILSKRISKGKTTSYYVELKLNELVETSEDYTVDKALYKTKNVGDTVAFYLYKGSLDISYYEIE